MDTLFDENCSVAEVARAAAAAESLAISAGIDEHRRDSSAEPDDNEIAAADWLEVSNAMLDQVNAS